MQAKAFAIFSSLLIVLFVIELIRRQKMSFKYSLVWLATCLVASSLAVFDSALAFLSKLAGFTLPSNFIFFLLMVFIILLSLLLTIYINEQNSRSEILAQSVALLEYKIKQLQSKTSEKEKKDGG